MMAARQARRGALARGMRAMVRMQGGLCDRNINAEEIRQGPRNVGYLVEHPPSEVSAPLTRAGSQPRTVAWTGVGIDTNKYAINT